MRKPWTTSGGAPARASYSDEDRLVLEPEPQGQLSVEDVEAVGVLAVDVEIGAHAMRPPPGCVALSVVVGEDLDAPMGRVADHLAATQGNEDGPTHEWAV